MRLEGPQTEASKDSKAEAKVGEDGDPMTTNENSQAVVEESNAGAMVRIDDCRATAKVGNCGDKVSDRENIAEVQPLDFFT